jgi:hypothetical protein
MSMMGSTLLLLALAVAFNLIDTNAFVPAVPSSLRFSNNRVFPRSAVASRQRSSFLAFQTGDNRDVVGEGDLHPQIKITTTKSDFTDGKSIESDPTMKSIPVARQVRVVERKIVLPSSTAPPKVEPVTETEPPTSTTKLQLHVSQPDAKRATGRRKSLSKLFKTTPSPSQQRLSFPSKNYFSRPGMQFRLRLGLATVTAFSLTTFLFFPRHRTKLLQIVQRWLASRGFQGISALGRSIAYIWALLVGYPRLLDRRAHEGKRRDQEKHLERCRAYLRSLAAEVSRFRQELVTIDTEIRSFRREIITLKAYSKDEDPDVQEAISAEMAHLAQLRSDTQAGLAAARQAWAEARSKSPPEVFDDLEQARI